MKGDKESDQIIEFIDGAIADFNGSMPDLQKKAYARVVQLLSELDQTKDGTIKPTLKNVKLINQVKQELQVLIINKQYKAQVDKYMASFDKIEPMNNDYYAAIGFVYSNSGVFNAYKQQALSDVKESLLTTGIKSEVVNKLGDILTQNITTGGSYSDLTNQVRVFLTDTKEGDGALVKYAKTYTVDAISQYNATYNKIASDDLGMVFYRFTGSLMTTSREICIKLIEAKNNGCLPYIHESQFQSIINGQVCGEQLPLYKKTGLPYGMKAKTNPSNLLVYRNGWGCQHQYYPVPSVLVPEDIRNKFNVKI